ncbi:mercuric reductase [Granulicella arctica]|uniref:Pyruvate/2-oxoglutarate dehydrogenase complex dihydrolipoamide dehydrogenase (E3) component n=1 Tax=Granulicella arctica TaxID=940613 RepID=A0A7Y9PH76_9BACT|nr:mercuric reductase [Granulicella arctica]NYF79694.1 pyruvate/2-oxoglutarate dehydrogenase complex dihydrolipoamide dehydrogenase (E3) component [Granulicella arctica]
MDVERFDAIVIGSGQGGNPLAAAMAEHGWKTVVVERRFVGGTCVNVGCTPTKTMVASARVAYLARRAADFGVENRGVRVDMAAVRARKDAVVEKWRAGSYKRLTETKNLSLMEGEAAFVGSHEIEVTLNAGGTRRLTAERIFIDTGVRTAVPAIEGIDSVEYLNNETVMELGAIPEHLIVLGGGYIALEFAQMFRRFGSAVTVVQKGDRLAEHEDEDVSLEISQILREDGVEVVVSAETLRVERTSAGVRLTVKTMIGEWPVEGSHLLVAVGRVPNTEALGLERAGVEVDERGFVKVDEWLETTVGGVYGIGDVKGGPEFTHISYDDYRVLKANLLEGKKRSTKGRPVPYTMFMDPELGRIGMTEAEARATGKKIKVAKMPMAWVARAYESGETRGFMKAVVDAETDLILGAACLGVNGGEVATQIQIAMMGGVTASELRDGIWSHPTFAEALNNLFSKYEDEE